MAAIPTGKKLYLCTPSLKPITQLNGVDTESASYSEHLRDYSSLTFDVYEYITIRGEQVRSNGYDELDVYMYLYLEDIAYFQMQHPTVHNDGIKEYKSVTAYSIDKEWEDKDWVNFKVNTGEKDSLEQLAEDNTDDLGFTINFVEFFNPDREDLSLLHLILEKMPNWTVDSEDIDHELWEKKLSFSEDSINLYALMTSTIAPRAECIFIFDCLNRKIKAISKNNLDFDTNIFVGFRNLASQIEQTVNEDSVFTRFNVAGGNNLTVNDWNYNNGRIFNLDYFLREPYMSDEQVSKFKTWIEWQDEHRGEFANLSQQVSDLESKIYDLKYRVPDDGTRIDQWKKMDREGLDESLKYYQSLLSAFEVSVDSNPAYIGSDGNLYHIDESGKMVDESGVIIQPGITVEYNPWTVTEDGETHVDYERYYELLMNMENGKAGYYTYYEIVTYIIPNIEIAIWNDENAPTEDDEKDYNEEFETNWELYGLEELKGRLEDYENRTKVLEGYSKYPRYFLQFMRLTDFENYVLNSFEVTGMAIVSGGISYEIEDILAIEGVKSVGFLVEETEEEENELYVGITSEKDVLFEDDIISFIVDFKYKTTEESEYTTGRIEHNGLIVPEAIGDFNGDDQWERLYEEYWEKIGYIGDEETENTIKWWIKELEEEIDEIGQEEQGYNLSRMEMVAKVSMYETEILDSDENEYGYDVIELDEPNSEWDFTLDDIKLFYTLMHDTDYTNENILITSLNTTSTITSTETIIQKEEELWKDAKEKLSEISQPQITFSVSMDNIMQIKEFEGLKDDCSLLRFIRLGVRDDYSVKLRIVGRSWNPCDVTDDFSLEFSNMVTSESGRSDLTDLLNNGGGSAGKNSITIGSGNSDSDKEYAANLLSLMVSTGLFSSAINKAGGVGNVDESQVNSMIENYMLNNVLNEASFNKIFSKYIDVELLVADAIKTTTITADQIVDGNNKTIIDLVNDNIDIGTITTDIITGHDSQGHNYIDLITGALDMDTIATSLITGQDSQHNYYIDLITGALNMGTIYGNLITGTDGNNHYYIDLLTGELNMDTIATSLITGIDGNNQHYIDLITGALNMDTIYTNLITGTDGNNNNYIDLLTGELNMDTIFTNLITGQDGNNDYYIDLLTGELNMNTIAANTGFINTLVAQNGFINNVQSISSNTVSSVVTDAYIYNAVAGKISVADLQAGDITVSNSARILSDNGMMIMNGTALQIFGEDSQGNPYVGIQLGYDTSSNPSLIVRNEDGATILTPSGITSDAIADELIVNDMVKDGTLTKSKLGFMIVDTDENGNISIANVKDGSGGNFGVEYTNFKNTTNTSLSALDTKIDNSATYTLHIVAPNGKNLRGGSIVLQAKLFKNSVEITDEYDARYFTWTRHSKDNYGDTYWNQAHTTGTKTITITGNDVVMSADFECTFEYNDVTVTSGQEEV